MRNLNTEELKQVYAAVGALCSASKSVAARVVAAECSRAAARPTTSKARAESL